MMRLSLTRVAFAGLGLLAWAGVAPAQNAGEAQANRPAGHAEGDLPGPIDSPQDLRDTAKMLFKLSDTNNDGQISQKEAVDVGNLLVGGFFFRADQNGDGTISQEEAKQAREALFSQQPLLRYVLERGRPQGGRQEQGRGSNANPAQALGNLLDANNDKQLQASEVRQAVQTAVQGIFATADTNRDGELSPGELNAALATAARGMAQAAFQAADSDGNGQISQAEFEKAIVEPSRAVFRVLDANGDGQISQQEAQQAQRVIGSQIQMLQVPTAGSAPGQPAQAPRATPAPAPRATPAPAAPAPRPR